MTIHDTTNRQNLSGGIFFPKKLYKINECFDFPMFFFAKFYLLYYLSKFLTSTECRKKIRRHRYRSLAEAEL